MRSDGQTTKLFAIWGTRPATVRSTTIFGVNLYPPPADWTTDRLVVSRQTHSADVGGAHSGAFGDCGAATSLLESFPTF